MNEEEIEYVELKLRQTKKWMGKRHPAHRRREFPWHRIAICLGILCFFLLLVISILGYMFFQKCENVASLEGNITFTSEVKYHSTLTTFTGKQNPSAVCHGKWSCCIKDCYYISTEKITWEESKRSCQSHGASLLKIDDKEEQRFIQSQIKNDYWIGLHKEGKNKSWLWLDNSGVLQHLCFQLSSKNSDNCGYIKSSCMSTGNCARKIRYICEKKSYYPYK